MENWDNIFNLVLEDTCVTLRPLELSDRDGLAAIAFESEIWTHFISRIDDDPQLEEFLRSAIDGRKTKQRAAFAIIERSSGRIAGSTSYGNLAFADRRLEIGWSWLGKPFRGTAVNVSAKRLLLRHAFGPLACERVEFKTDILNQRARSALRKIGATEEGVLRSYNYMPGGRRRDAVYYSVITRDWQDVSRILDRMVST
jgi:RimJ/RimL family protein N-acetyltransferase